MSRDDGRDNERAHRRRIIEALILASPEPQNAARLANVVPGCSATHVKELVEELNAEYASSGRAFEICEVAGGYQLRTLAEFASYLQQSRQTRPLRLSQAALETLAIVAYRQPVTRAEVEHVRGVDVGAVLRSLLERKLVRIAGHRDVPGRPLLYGTHKRFLEVFGLGRIEDLPTLRDLAEFEKEESVALLRGAGDAGDAAGDDSDGSAPDDPDSDGSLETESSPGDPEADPAEAAPDATRPAYAE